METILFGVLPLPWWGIFLVAVASLMVTLASVTIYLHRHQTHRAIDLHPIASHFFRFSLWLTTGMKTREWAAIHRKHHAKCETIEDPHSPVHHGVLTVLFSGWYLYVRESKNKTTIAAYGTGAPDDWLERNVYSRFTLTGLTLMGLADVALFGVAGGIPILLAQIACIPFFAAGVINGLGHSVGYRNYDRRFRDRFADHSTNIVPWGIIIAGEELHNNHHEFPTSAKFSVKPWEFDLGWLYIRILEALGLATVRHRHRAS